jgi:hypothetical protein
MFGLGAATRIYLGAGATDMRKGFEGLYGSGARPAAVRASQRAHFSCSRMRNGIA